MERFFQLLKSNREYHHKHVEMYFSFTSSLEYKIAFDKVKTIFGPIIQASTVVFEATNKKYHVFFNDYDGLMIFDTSNIGGMQGLDIQVLKDILNESGFKITTKFLEENPSFTIKNHRIFVNN